MSIIDPATVRYCLAQGMTQTELAREYGVTRQYIHKLAKQAGHEPLRTIVTENFPWPIKPEFTKKQPLPSFEGCWFVESGPKRGKTQHATEVAGGSPQAAKF